MLTHSFRHRPVGRRYVVALFTLLVILASTALLALTQSRHPTSLTRNLDALPIAFVPNVGQADSAVRFTAHQSEGNLLFGQSQVVLLPNPPRPRVRDAQLITMLSSEAKGHSHTLERSEGSKLITAQALGYGAPPLTLTFEGANPDAELRSGASLPGKANFVLGSRRDRWRENLSTFSDITYRSLYPGVDLSLSGTGIELASRYVVAPGTDPTIIRSHYSPTGRPAIDQAGNLHISAQRALVAKPPAGWQEIGSLTIPVSMGYVVSPDGTVGFAAGPYDKARPLHIDSTLIYSTYLGGSGRDDAFPVAADDQGNAYIAGSTGSYDYPLAQAVQPYYGGDSDVFISKINPTGTALVYSTYLGGSGYDEAWGLAVDSSYNMYVTGVTSSTDFPTVNPLQPTNHGYNDAFVTKINPSGSALVYSTYLGGTGYDMAQSIAISGGTVYIAGETSSTDFPMMNPVQSDNGGSTDIFVARLNTSGTGLIFSTYLGGAGEEGAPGVAADDTGAAYVAGISGSSNFPVSAHNTFQPYHAGGLDSVVAKIAPQGSTLIYSTYLGGDSDDRAWGVVVTPDGDAIVTGGSNSDDFPIRDAVQPVKSTGTDVFVTELSSTGSWLVYSTYIGGNGDYDAPYGISRDPAGNVYVAGVTDSTDFPTLDPVQPSIAGGDDFFLFELGRRGQPLIFSTYLGGSLLDLGWSAAVDPQGNMYLSGNTRSTDFPTPNALQPYNAGGDDNIIAKFAPITAPTSTPQPCTISFSDVPPGTTFYPYVHCLACEGIVEGYADGTYKPNNITTRGQLAKIVSNAAGYRDHVTLQVFEDMPVGSTFFSQTAELASRGIVAGYPCGRSGEPCVPPLNLPYFEPNANVTRGQAAKIVALTASFAPPPSGQQTFEDVPTTQTFYPWIETMASLGFVNGYPCGGPSEPCVPPLNRPYYRPGATTTRGQVAKLAANTFFPDLVQSP